MAIPTHPSRRWTLRAFFAALLAPLGYVGYRVAAHNHWIIVTEGRRQFDAGTEPRRSKGDSELSLLLVGDTGKNTSDRASVVAAMRQHAVWSRPAAALLLGDNFYERGVLSVDDPRFDLDFESLFDAESFDMPFYACLGNHDVGGDADAQVLYSERSQRWKMPARYFRLRRSAGQATVDIFVIDTNLILDGSSEFDLQIEWLHSELFSSDADYKIVAGHHPAITGGQHGVTPQIAEVLPPIFAEYGVDLYLSGHDHDLQMLDSGQGWMQIVSGAGSKLRSTSWIDETVFAGAIPGFCWLLIDKDQLAVSFYSSARRLFTHHLPHQRGKPAKHIATSRTTKNLLVGIAASDRRSVL